LALLLYNLMR